MFEKKVLVHFSASEAFSNKVEGIIQQPILWAVDKYTKTRFLSKLAKNLQNNADNGKIKMAKM